MMPHCLSLCRTLSLLAACAPLLVLTSSACVHSGTAEGEFVSGPGEQQPVTFTWKSAVDDPTRGSMSVVLPDGRQFAGPYFEITESTRPEILSPLWENWEDRFWDTWAVPQKEGASAVESEVAFVSLYTGQVVANLTGNHQTHLRCRFSLQHPSRGLAGGGVGECQMNTGDRIDTAVLRPG